MREPKGERKEERKVVYITKKRRRRKKEKRSIQIESLRARMKNKLSVVGNA